jgi:hypothetical protein
MKKFLLFCLLIVTWGTVGSQPQGNLPGSPNFAVVQKFDERVEGEDEIVPFSYEQEILSRKLYQRTLPPMTRMEKVAWSFRTAQSDPFL